MFFIDGDWNNTSKQRGLREVIDDDNAKVAYGVLSLSTFYKMAKHMPGVDKIFIPKVQRGLVWGQEHKDTFIKNCVKPEFEKIREPMPNIFLFCDKNTKEIQLFDGLQRTVAILNEFKKIENITNQYDIMIPAALFKGSRIEAEALFKNINDKGIKLNDFEKLASDGGKYEVNLQAMDSSFIKEFNEFIDNISKKYINVGLKTTSGEKTTIYEVLTYAIYHFSKIIDAKTLFNIKKDKFIDEWGFQIAYSTTTKEDHKIYTKKLMNKRLLKDFSKYIEYDKEKKIFNVEKLNKYIYNLTHAIEETRHALKGLFDRNIIANNKDHICKDAIKSKSLVASVVIAYYLNRDEMSYEFVMKWYLLQLISGRAEKNTNKIIDELLISIKNDKISDISTEINNKIINKIEKDKTAINSKKWLWTLFYIQWEEIRYCHTTTEFEIDHIIPKKALKNNNIKIDEQNNIGNLMLIKKAINRKKASKPFYEFFKNEPNNMQVEIQKYIANNNYVINSILTVNEEFYKNIDNKNEEMINESYKYFTKIRVDYILKKLKEN